MHQSRPGHGRVKKYRMTRLSAASPGNLQKCSAKRDKFRTYPRLTLFVCLSSLFWLTHGKPSGFVHAPPPSQVSPVTGSRHRGTHACAYSTGCQLRTLTGFPYPCACTFRQTGHREITNNSIVPIVSHFSYIATIFFTQYIKIQMPWGKPLQPDWLQGLGRRFG